MRIWIYIEDYWKGVKAMKMVSVNVSMPKTVDHLGRLVSRGYTMDRLANSQLNRQTYRR